MWREKEQEKIGQIKAADNGKKGDKPETDKGTDAAQ